MTAQDVFRRVRELFETGDTAEARKLALEGLALDPNHVDTLALLGMLLVRTGERSRALPYWQRVAQLVPQDATHRYNLAELLRQLRRPDDAEPEFRAAVSLAPHWTEAMFGLANCLKDRGRVEAALAAYGQVLELQPTFARALYNRGNLLRDQGRVAEAERDYRQALTADPGLTDALVNLAAALGDLHRWAEAEDCYRQALRNRPEDEDLKASLAGAVLAQGRMIEGTRILDEIESDSPVRALTRFRRETTLPLIAASAAAITADRARLTEFVERAQGNPPPLDRARLHHPGLEPPMALAYHAESARSLMEQYAALYGPQIEPLEVFSSTNARPRVGVVVTHGHEGVYDRCLGRLVERIAAGRRVHITLVCSPAGANVLRHLRPSFSGDYLTLPVRVDEAALQIRDARFDVLHYWEVGTDATNYFLPYFRPAHVQCATWGWPVTTGNPRIDYYVSATPLEPAGADAHYTEQLVRLRSLPTCYERPPAPPAPSGPAARRQAFGVDAATPVYLCVQNLRKLHPDFDTVLGELLTRDPRGRVVLLADDQPGITEALLQRLRLTLGPDMRRVGVTPRLDRTGYLRLVSSADVLLDTLHYGSGANTVADAVACGTPIVTLPGQFHRCRWAAAVLRQAGLDDHVVRSVTEYVESAIRLATDEPVRRKASETLMEFGKEWFDNPRPAEELETFWLEQAAVSKL